MQEQRLRMPDIQCPFYIADQSREIVCEGCGDAESLQLRYRKMIQKKKQLEVFCCGSYQKCEIYRMLMETKYDL